MRFSLAIISAFIVLVIINVSYVNAKNIMTTTDGKINLENTLKHGDKAKDENTTSKNNHGKKSKCTHISHKRCTLPHTSTTQLPDKMLQCPNGYYYNDRFGCVKILDYIV
ncbi:uncharacterized protein LOC112591222 [Melanaphis sacchari]|uniref:uncharacterized protein LOC112591222 n=1 Tax=Melanaphis sacchari TaxID=742174 RepID=UPI000DC14CBB|nr:uncharacterized protein LOC112591222 [Melanaphis sacchari]